MRATTTTAFRRALFQFARGTAGYRPATVLRSHNLPRQFERFSSLPPPTRSPEFGSNGASGSSSGSSSGRNSRKSNDNYTGPNGNNEGGRQHFVLPFALITGLYLHTKLGEFRRHGDVRGHRAAEEITAQHFFSHLVPTKSVAHVEICGKESVHVTPKTEAAESCRPKEGKTEFVFRIASPEAFEAKLEASQQRLGIAPEDQIPVRHTAALPSWWGPAATAAATTVGVLVLLALLRGRATAHQDSTMRALRVGRASPTTLKDISVPLTFNDVAGMHDAKVEVMEFVDFLRNPQKYERLGAQVPKGALLVGPPGTGKTLLARAVAGEAQVPFFSMSGSDFMEIFVGVGPSRVRDLFAQARKAAPSIVFIDEIDAVGRKRQKGGFGGNAHDERESTLNQLLVELDGFVPGTSVVVLAGTNRPDVLDAALTRPGRFDRTVMIEKPDLSEREEIFATHMKPLLVAPAINVEELRKRLAALTPGFSGADIRNVCNEAAIYAARRSADGVEVSDFERACERVIGGIEKTSGFLTQRVRDTVAVHEAGHAVCGWFLPGADPVVKVSIVPRMNGALGFAQNLPEEVQLLPKEQICDRIGVLLGGRVAEELAQHTATTGAHDDLDKATRLAYAYTSCWGFSPRLGLRSFPLSGEENSPLCKPYGDELARAIDDEAGSLLNTQYERVKALLSNKFHLVKTLAAKLKEKETLVYSDLVDVLGKRPYPLREEYERYIAAAPQLELLEAPADSSNDKNEDFSAETLCPG